MIFRVLYIFYIRPKLAYASWVCSLSLMKHIELMEKVKGRATKMGSE